MFAFIQMGGGGLVFQDRYRLDRLALIKNFSQWRKLMIFLRKNEWTDVGLNRWFEKSDLDVEQLANAAVRAIEDWLEEETLEFEPDEG